MYNNDKRHPLDFFTCSAPAVGDDSVSILIPADPIISSRSCHCAKPRTNSARSSELHEGDVISSRCFWQLVGRMDSAAGLLYNPSSLNGSVTTKAFPVREIIPQQPASSATPLQGCGRFMVATHTEMQRERDPQPTKCTGCNSNNCPKKYDTTDSTVVLIVVPGIKYEAKCVGVLQKGCREYAGRTIDTFIGRFVVGDIYLSLQVFFVCCRLSVVGYRLSVCFVLHNECYYRAAVAGRNGVNIIWVYVQCACWGDTW